MSNQSSAQDDFFNTIPVDINRTSSSTTPYSVFGWITQKLAYGLESPSVPFSRQSEEINKIETSLFTQFDYRIDNNTAFRFSGKAYHDSIYHFNGDTDYSADERDKFRNRYEIKDFYVERRFENGAYLKLGKQMFAWGLAEYTRVADIINTEDQFTFGQQDLEDIRQQVPAALLSFNTGDWLIESVFTHRAGRNDLAPAGDEFDQIIQLRNSSLSLSRSDPDKDHEVFVRASTHWSRGDLQLVAGEFNDNSLSVDRIEAIKSISPRVNFSQNRMRAIAAAANWVNGNWQLFGELGIHYNKAVQPDATAFFRNTGGWDEKDQLLSVLGVEYNGFRDLILTFEVDNTHTRAHDEHMQAGVDQVSIGARLYWTALNERLRVLAVWNELTTDDARVGRLSLDYSLSDRFSAGLLWMNYSSVDNSIFRDFRNNDVLQLQMQFNFQN